MVPLGELASIHVTLGPPSIRTEDAQPVDYIMSICRAAISAGMSQRLPERLPSRFPCRPVTTSNGAASSNISNVREAKLKVVIPATLIVIFVLLFLNFGRLTETVIVMLSVPFALVGGIWLMWALGYNMSVAVAVGFIALAGVAAETGVVMLIYLDHAFAEISEQRRHQGQALTRSDLRRAIMSGAVERVRPKMMTVVAIMAGLLPILWSDGTGSEVMKRIAVPMVGGMVSSTILTLLVIPAIYAIVKGWRLPRDYAAPVVMGEQSPSPAE